MIHSSGWHAAVFLSYLVALMPEVHNIFRPRTRPRHCQSPRHQPAAQLLPSLDWNISNSLHNEKHGVVWWLPDIYDLWSPNTIRIMWIVDERPLWNVSSILWSSGKGQARIGKGWQSRRKALKLKPLPRAYIKVGCHHPPPPPTTHKFKFT